MLVRANTRANVLSVPTSAETKSRIWSCQVPCAFLLYSGARDCNGWYRPVKGATPAEIRVEASESNTVRVKLSFADPLREKSRIAVPSGATSVASRSPSHVCEISISTLISLYTNESLTTKDCDMSVLVSGIALGKPVAEYRSRYGSSTVKDPVIAS